MAFLAPFRAFLSHVRPVGAVALTGAALAFGQVPAAFAQAAKGEAPALATQVAAGKLDSVDKRVPKNPLVITPAEKVGVYGGTLRSLISGPGDYSWFRTMFGYESLLIWDLKAQKVVPNLAEMEVSPDATKYTFKLREGMKWSDGEPFTAKDIMFWWNDVYTNDKVPTAADLAGGDLKPRFIREGSKPRRRGA